MSFSISLATFHHFFSASLGNNNKVWDPETAETKTKTQIWLLEKILVQRKLTITIRKPKCRKPKCLKLGPDIGIRLVNRNNPGTLGQKKQETKMPAISGRPEAAKPTALAAAAITAATPS